MCRRDTTDPLVRMFLDRYRMNLLALPGRRVRCGSVYIKHGRGVTAPGDLAGIVEPRISLPAPFFEDRLPDLSSSWSGKVTVTAGLGLLETFLTALGAASLVDELRGSVTRTHSRSLAFRFRQASRESLSPTALARALEGCRFTEGNAWIRKGNRYFAVAAVVSSPSISVQGRDAREAVVDLGAGLATVGKLEGEVRAERQTETELLYRAEKPLAVAVELYELRWDDDRGQLMFNTPKGPLPLVGVADDEPPDPVLIGDDEDAFIAPVEPPETAAGEDCPA
jgi:hypothetical protein